MTDKELKKLSRKELLEMLILQARKNEALEKKIEELQNALDDKMIAIENAGDLATAILQLNGIFEAAQKTADQYLENIKRRDEASKRQCAHILANAEVAAKKKRQMASSKNKRR